MHWLAPPLHRTDEVPRSARAICTLHSTTDISAGGPKVSGGWDRLGIVGHYRRIRRRCAVGGLLGDGSCPGFWTSPRRCAGLALR